MKKTKKQKQIFSSIIYFILYLVIISAVLWSAYTIIQLTLEANRRNRAFDELHEKVRMQVAITEELVNREYAQLHIIESILTSQNEIDLSELNAVWEMMSEREELTMFGFADMSGDVINCNGEKTGNIVNRESFLDIVQGRATEKCVVLNTTIQSGDSEFFYMIPVYIEGRMEGVLFKSKKISSIENSLIEDVQFDGSASMFVVNTAGDILLVGDGKDRFLLEHNIFDGGSNFVFKESQEEKLKNDLRGKKSGEFTFEQNDRVKYAVYTPSGVGEWMIVSTVDRDAAAMRYESNDEVIEKSMILVLILFTISLVVSVVLVVLYVKKRKKSEQESFYKYQEYQTMMNELTFPVFRYHVNDDSIKGNKRFQENFGRRSIDHISQKRERWKKLHPEYNFDGLFSEIDRVIQNRQMATFESVLQVKNKRSHWFKTILIPVNDDVGGELNIFGTVMDTTQEHKYNEETIEIMGNAPVGLYRCYLNEPFRVEYMNEGFQRMLGYNGRELDQIIGLDGNYANFLGQQDQRKFEAFLRKVRESGASDTCEYHMICKDGSQLMVSDTIEVKEGGDGIKYGYGVVTDISKYREVQKKNEEKLEKLRIQLNESRIKISTGQMQPHFLYNALASIREIVLENPEYAADLIFDFTTHLRACIKSMASEDLISFSQEIENIKAYVSIEKMRFGDRMKVLYEIEECDFLIVPLSIQPLVENAIRHGIYERGSEGGTVRIRSYCEEDTVVIQVEDNGVGFDVEKVKREVQCHERDSTGLQSLIFRFENLMEAKVKIESVIGKGTRVTVRIPVKGENKCEQ